MHRIALSVNRQLANNHVVHNKTAADDSFNEFSLGSWALEMKGVFKLHNILIYV